MALERRKILLLIPSLAGGGAERVFTMLLNQLDRRRFELHLGILQDDGAYTKDVPADVKIHHLNISRVRYALPSLVRLVRKLKPKVILSTLGHLNLALISTRVFMPAGTRIVVREAAVASAFLELETRHPRLWRWLYRRLYKRADIVVCLSDSMLNDMIEQFEIPREKLIRIYNPVDISRLRELAGAAENPYSGPGPHLVAAGRLTKQKGFDVLLNSMPAVFERLPTATLVILGQGPLATELKVQSQTLGLADRVSFSGFQANPWPYLKHADLFILSSRYEGTPNVLLEALALGTPAVATECPGGTREIQAHDPDLVLVPAENEQALAQAIIRTCCAPRRTDNIQQVQQRLQPFDLREIVLAYSRILERV